MNVAIIGCGVMGSCLARNITNVNNLILCAKRLSSMEELKKELKCKTTENALEAYDDADVVVIAVKPKTFPTIVSQIQQSDSTRPKLILSIMAGVSLKELEKSFPSDFCVRVMPNLPLIINEGVIAVSYANSVKRSEREIVRDLLDGLGLIVDVPENLIDPITVISGCGPGYICMFLEAMVEAGVHMGIKSSDAKDYAIETLLGTARLLKESKLSLSELKHKVASPGGTTIRAIVSMEKKGVRSGITQGLLDAYDSLS